MRAETCGATWLARTEGPGTDTTQPNQPVLPSQLRTTATRMGSTDTPGHGGSSTCSTAAKEAAGGHAGCRKHLPIPQSVPIWSRRTETSKRHMKHILVTWSCDASRKLHVFTHLERKGQRAQQQRTVQMESKCSKERAPVGAHTQMTGSWDAARTEVGSRLVVVPAQPHVAAFHRRFRSRLQRRRDAPRSLASPPQAQRR